MATNIGWQEFFCEDECLNRHTDACLDCRMAGTRPTNFETQNSFCDLCIANGVGDRCKKCKYLSEFISPAGIVEEQEHLMPIYLTAKELAELLQCFPDNTPVIFNNGGYVTRMEYQSDRTGRRLVLKGEK